MEIEIFIRDYFDLPKDGWAEWLPADHIDRQDWQVAIEAFVMAIRDVSHRPAFGLSEADISVHYHSPLERFALLINGKLGNASRSDPGGTDDE